jgi:hypothetical protein
MYHDVNVGLWNVLLGKVSWTWELKRIYKHKFHTCLFGLNLLVATVGPRTSIVVQHFIAYHVALIYRKASEDLNLNSFLTRKYIAECLGYFVVMLLA